MASLKNVDLSHSAAPEIAAGLLLMTVFAVGLVLAWPWW
jgi:hypothetical protein